MTKKKNWLEALWLILFLALLAAFISVSTAVLTPKRNSYGGTWSAYLQESRNSYDVIIVGSSLVYCDINPLLIYDECGIAAYDVAGPTLTMAEAYYYVREALKTQSPDLVALEVSPLYYAKNGQFDNVSIGYMPFGRNKLETIFTAARREDRLGFLFPLYNYHSRWTELSGEDIAEGLGPAQTDDIKGYTFLSDSVGDTALPETQGAFEGADMAIGYEYLGKIADLCRERHIELAFFYVPRLTCYEDMPGLWAGVEAAAPGVPVMDFNAAFDDYGFDPAADFYDARHLNWRGAEKFNTAFCRWLSGFELSGRSGGGWDSAREKYDGFLAGVG